MLNEKNKLQQQQNGWVIVHHMAQKQIKNIRKTHRRMETKVG